MRTEEDQSRPEAIVNPIPLSLRASPEDSLSALDRLRKESLPHLEELCSRLQAETGLISEIHSKSIRSAEEKSRRPSVRRGKPWFTVAHIRDFLRFRTSFGSIQETQKLLRFFAAEVAAGRMTIVKLETAKFQHPNPYGWRMIATDIRLGATGMIVEHYMSYADMILANQAMTHAVYERWRHRGEGLTIGERKRMVAEIGLCQTANLAIFCGAATRRDFLGFASSMESLRTEGEVCAAICRERLDLFTARL